MQLMVALRADPRRHRDRAPDRLERLPVHLPRGCARSRTRPAGACALLADRLPSRRSLRTRSPSTCSAAQASRAATTTRTTRMMYGTRAVLRGAGDQHLRDVRTHPHDHITPLGRSTSGLTIPIGSAHAPSCCSTRARIDFRRRPAPPTAIRPRARAPAATRCWSAASAATRRTPRALNMWVVSDNLLKGAATNAVQIAEVLHERGLVRVPARQPLEAPAVAVLAVRGRRAGCSASAPAAGRDGPPPPGGSRIASPPVRPLGATASVMVADARPAAASARCAHSGAGRSARRRSC